MVMSRRSLTRLGGVAAVSAASLATLAGLPSPAAAVRSPRGTVASAATVALRSTSLGRILVNGRGHTLYAFTKDGRNKDRCVTTEGCTSAWPLLTVKGKPHAGAGVKGSKLSTITVAGGSHQVTYAGHPLYTYVSDSGPGETSYVGVSQFGGKWLAVQASGSLKG
jgi:predicted lipoprotein with Yx(FWY)xxD motif